MRRYPSFLSFIFLSVFSLNICADEIVLYTWEDYFSPAVISQFEKESGHKVKQVYFESEMLRDAVMHSGKADAYDLVILDGYTLNQFSKQGLLGKLEPSLFKETSELFSSDAINVCGQYGIPYAYGSMGIGYQTSKVSTEFNSWMELFDYAKKTPNSAVILDEDIDTLAIALMALGYHPLSENEEELRQAYKLLDSTMDSLLAFRNSAGYALEKKGDSKMDVGVLYSGETESIANATQTDDWRYVIPKEGTLIWYECLVSHKSRPMSKASIEFVNFLNRPEIAAQNAQDVWFATPNRAALKLAEEEYLDDEELFPKTLTENNKFYYKAISDESLKLRANIISILSKQ